MSESQFYYQGFITAIQNKIPNRANLANKITELLDIDKDAVYRRLRGEVNFTFIEIAAIATSLGLSLDNIVASVFLEHRPVQITLSKHVNPTEVDYRMFNNFVNLLGSVKDNPDTLLLEANNTLPYSIYYDYECFTRFHMFSWALGNTDGIDIPFHQITIPEPMRALQKKVCEYTRHIKTTQYIWDRMIFQSIIHNISFFVRLRLIREEDVPMIKKELFEIINDIEQLAVRGSHEDTGNKVSFYISDILFETNYSTLKGQNMYLTLFKTFLLNANSTLDEDVYHNTSQWILALQRKATLISVSGEKIRAEFFNTQRKIIDSL